MKGFLQELHYQLENNRKEIRQLLLNISNQNERERNEETKRQTKVEDIPSKGDPPKQFPSTITDWIDVKEPGVHYQVMPMAHAGQKSVSLEEDPRIQP